MGLPKTTMPLDEIRQLPILDVYNRYVGGQLQRRGRHWWARCFWHGGDSDPSLKIYPDQNKWWCYGCQAGGTNIDLVMKALGLTIREAVQRLAADFGIEMAPAGKPDRKAARAAAEWRRQRELKAQFEKDFERVLTEICRLIGSLTALIEDPFYAYRYPSVFRYLGIAEIIEADMNSIDRETQVRAWRHAKAVFPWITQT